MTVCEPPYHRLDCRGGCDLAVLVDLVRSVVEDPDVKYAPSRTLARRRIYAARKEANERI